VFLSKVIGVLTLLAVTLPLEQPAASICRLLDWNNYAASKRDAKIVGEIIHTNHQVTQPRANATGNACQSLV